MAKHRPDDLVTHPFPKKGSKRFIKFSYREYLLSESSKVKRDYKQSRAKPERKRSTEKKNAAPLLTKDEVLSAERAKEFESELKENPVISESNDKILLPPFTHKEVKIESSDRPKLISLGKHLENSIDIRFRYFSMDKFVYWIPKEINL